MVSRPIEALRAVFGNRVAIVGACDDRIAESADQVIEDPYPGVGPIGGLCAALERTKMDVFVCAGDLVAIDSVTIEQILESALANQDALAVLASDGRRHPTLGLYRTGCTSAFQLAITKQHYKLGRVLGDDSICDVAVRSLAVRNVNRPEDLQD